MIRTLAAAVLALLMAVPAMALTPGQRSVLFSQKKVVAATPMVTPVFVDTNSTGPSNSATNYIGFNGGSFNATQANRESVVAIDGIVGNLRVNFPTAVTLGTTYDICLVKNGNATCISGGPACQIRSAALFCIDTIGAATVSAGDFLAWKVVPTGTPNSQTIVQIAATITATTNPTDSILSTPFLAGSSSTTATQYAVMGSSSLWDSTETNVTQVVPTAGTIDNLWAYQGGTAPGASKSIQFSLMKNGVATGLSCTLTGAGSGNNITFCHTTGNAVSFNSGDTFSIQASPTSTPAVGFQTFSARWTPATPGEAFIPIQFGPTLSTGGIQYMSGGGRSGSVTESSAFAIAPVAFTWKRLYASQTVVPGGTATRTIINRTGTGAGQSSGTITCTIPSASLSCTPDLVNTTSVAAGTFINWMETPANTPATALFRYSSVMATQ